MPLLPDIASFLTARSSAGSNPQPVYSSTSFDPLPAGIRHGMAAMGTIGLISCATTLTLICFITYRMVYWRKFYEHPLATNQIFVLIYNLLIADFQQALSFLLSFHWIAKDKLVGPSTACFAQGWLIQIGDLSSGLWVLAIGIHTFINLVGQRQVPNTAFFTAVVGIWLFALVLTLIGPASHGAGFFVPAGAWCWIGDEHEQDRLTLHYVWIFISQLGSLMIYSAIFFFLQMRMSNTNKASMAPKADSSTARSSDFNKGPRTALTTTTVVSQAVHDPFAVSRNRIMRTAGYMVVYPFAYVALTLPLAVGRVSAMAHKNPNLTFYCVSGTLMAACGAVDVALYIYTRKSLVKTSIGARGKQQQAGNRLTKMQTPGLRSRFPGDGSGRMDGHTKLDSDNDDEPTKKGVIVVSQSVTMSEEPYETSDGIYARAGKPKTESMKSLVLRKDDVYSDKS
ncbi:hypothetical protein LOCC1_G006134 [Lachnellula occidentalis]|uniref:G-protein coupled receptors family 2 profile 2 domain-containing protein n=1 Tax=Lachnellula occidentalis TaxID=215460 RepID=A0A8H8S016_9HELO|nr:hypothetical protein LOCC1_G006134 [Lachnellula occidentalis]